MVNDIDVESLVSGLSFLEITDALLKASFRLNTPIAIWTLPNSECLELIVGEEVLFNEKPQIETLEPGFLINGFEHQGIEGGIFLKSLFYINNESGFLIEKFNELSPRFRDVFLTSIKDKNPAQKAHTSYVLPQEKEYSKEKEYFQQNVIKAVDEINKGSFQKVILSRKKEIILDEEFSYVELFKKLCSLYKNAFTSLTFTPSTGIWIGASPETLISVKNNVFKTCALAATQQYVEDVPLKEVSWKQKEIEEQAFVRTYIINCLKKIRLREFDEEGPKTVRAGNLLHLKTDIKVNMKEVNFPNLASDMLDLLHPTSAVCGMPHKPALDFILEHEPFKRELYAGYLGPVNINNSIDLFVNLRCMKVEGNKGFLFAGVGITEDSVWEKEWQETEIKFRTLMNVLDL